MSYTAGGKRKVAPLNVIRESGRILQALPPKFPSVSDQTLGMSAQYSMHISTHFGREHF